MDNWYKFAELSEQAQDIAVSQYMELTGLTESEAKNDLADDDETLYTSFGSFVGHIL